METGRFESTVWPLNTGKPSTLSDPVSCTLEKLSYKTLGQGAWGLTDVTVGTWNGRATRESCLEVSSDARPAVARALPGALVCPPHEPERDLMTWLIKIIPGRMLAEPKSDGPCCLDAGYGSRLHVRVTMEMELRPVQGR